VTAATCLIDARPVPGQGSVEVVGGVALTAAVRGTIARLSSGMRPAGHRWRGEAQEGSALLEVALPSSSISVGASEEVRFGWDVW
jgi:hypothetical protein